MASVGLGWTSIALALLVAKIQFIGNVFMHSLIVFVRLKDVFVLQDKIHWTSLGKSTWRRTLVRVFFSLILLIFGCVDRKRIVIGVILCARMVATVARSKA
jgi:hypothetical protein